MEKKKLLEAIENEKMKSAWGRAKQTYAYELVESLEVKTVEEVTEELLLNGAKNWNDFSYGGCSLIYDCDIAERICTPSELKKCKGGKNQLNRNESWLDVQTRALHQASRMIFRLRKSLLS